MLRKTAAIAVLLLIVSSFALGSVGQVQTAAVTGIAQGAAGHFAVAGDRADVPPQKITAGMWHTRDAAGNSSFSYVPGADAGSSPAMAFVTMAGGQMISGVVPEENVMLTQSDENVSSVVFYMDELRMERPAFDSFGFIDVGNNTTGGAMFIIPARMTDRPDFDNLTINGRMAMIEPGADPQFYSFEWHKVREPGPAGNGTFARFAGHMVIPERNFSTGKTMAVGTVFRSIVGALEINSDMLVDMTTLQPVAAASQTDTSTTYDNNIAAGDTNWHVASVGSSIKSLNVDLKWSNEDGNLRLVIYTPDGKILGPYTDASDGKIDGRINLNIANSNGVATGDWHLKVTDTDTLGDTDYYVRTY